MEPEENGRLKLISGNFGMLTNSHTSNEHVDVAKQRKK